MKVVAFNGSARKDGNTAYSINHFFLINQICERDMP